MDKKVFRDNCLSHLKDFCTYSVSVQTKIRLWQGNRLVGNFKVLEIYLTRLASRATLCALRRGKRSIIAPCPRSGEGWGEVSVK